MGSNMQNKMLISHFLCRQNAFWTCSQAEDSATFLALPTSSRLSKAGEFQASNASPCFCTAASFISLFSLLFLLLQAKV